MNKPLPKATNKEATQRYSKNPEFHNPTHQEKGDQFLDWAIDLGRAVQEAPCIKFMAELALAAEKRAGVEVDGILAILSIKTELVLSTFFDKYLAPEKIPGLRDQFFPAESVDLMTVEPETPAGHFEFQVDRDDGSSAPIKLAIQSGSEKPAPILQNVS